MKSAVAMLGVILLLVATAGSASARSAGFGPPLPRSSGDRKDASHKPQVHVVYVVPSDAVDRALDTDGTLRRHT